MSSRRGIIARAAIGRGACFFAGCFFADCFFASCFLTGFFFAAAFFAGFFFLAFFAVFASETLLLCPRTTALGPLHAKIAERLCRCQEHAERASCVGHSANDPTTLYHSAAKITSHSG
jgi:hypothetical protein